MKKIEIDLDKEVRNTGIILIILGVLHFIFSGFLSFDWGIVLISLGIISLFYHSRKMILTFGISLILVGIMNLLSGVLDSVEGISAGWAIFGVFQIIWGIQEINRFRKIKENPKYDIKKKKRRYRGNSFGIVSLVLGILSIITSILMPLIAVVTSILGIIFSVKQNKESPNGMATAGLVTSIIGLIMGIIMWIINVILLSELIG